MANLYLADMKLTEQDTESVDMALSAFEKNMFGSAQKNQSRGVEEVATDSLRYLFAIFR